MAESSSSGLGLPAPPAVVPVVRGKARAKAKAGAKPKAKPKVAPSPPDPRKQFVYAGKVLFFHSHQAIRIPEVLKGLWRCLPISVALRTCSTACSKKHVGVLKDEMAKRGWKIWRAKFEADAWEWIPRAEHRVRMEAFRKGKVEHGMCWWNLLRDPLWPSAAWSPFYFWRWMASRQQDVKILGTRVWGDRMARLDMLRCVQTVPLPLHCNAIWIWLNMIESLWRSLRVFVRCLRTCSTVRWRAVKESYCWWATIQVACAVWGCGSFQEKLGKRVWVEWINVEGIGSLQVEGCMNDELKWDWLRLVEILDEIGMGACASVFVALQGSIPLFLSAFQKATVWQMVMELWSVRRIPYLALLNLFVGVFWSQ